MPTARKRKQSRDRKQVKRVKREKSLFELAVKLHNSVNFKNDPLSKFMPKMNVEKDDLKEREEECRDDVLFPLMDRFKNHRGFKRRWHNFKLRAGMDPYFSTCDPIFDEIGNKNSELVRQNMKNEFKTWQDAERNQYQKYEWKIWLDPSASNLILPMMHTHADGKRSKIVKANPCSMDLKKQFGNDVEFVYISPPWKTDRHGYGKKGWFTDKHLKKINLSFQRQGFCFLWGCYDYHHEVFETMAEKGYVYCDSVSSVLSDWHGKIEMSPRNPKPRSQHDSIMSRTAGTTVQGFVFKKITKQAYRLGNQICCDCFLWRRKKDKESGQCKYDHGYAFQLHEYMSVDKPKKFNPQKPHAVHLFCEEKFTRCHWGGVRYVK